MEAKQEGMLYRGAEAALRLEDIEDRTVLVKERISKGYRLPELDIRIRAQRTKAEAGLMSRSIRAGIPVPKIINLGKTSITMEFISGKLLKESIGGLEKAERLEIYCRIGDVIAALHGASIIHGDLTPANMILNEGKIYLVDFGLGKFSDRAEDKASDLFLLFEAFKSTHNKLLGEAWASVLNAYKQRYVGAEEVLKRLEEIKKRRRYR